MPRCNRPSRSRWRCFRARSAEERGGYEAMPSRRPGAAGHAQRREEGRYLVKRVACGHDTTGQGDRVVGFELRRAHPSAPGLEFDADETAAPAHDDVRRAGLEPLWQSSGTVPEELWLRYGKGA